MCKGLPSSPTLIIVLTQERERYEREGEIKMGEGKTKPKLYHYRS